MNAQVVAPAVDPKPEPPPHAPAHGLVQPATLIANNLINKTARPLSNVMRQTATLVAPQTS